MLPRSILSPKYAIFLAAISGLSLGSLDSDAAGIAGSRHDLSTGMGSSYKHGAPYIYNQYTDPCVFCHTPHSTPTSSSLFWNRPYSTANYIVYSSPTNKLIPGQPDSSTSSALCLSCHDGTIAVDTVVTKPDPGYVVASNHRRMSKDFTLDSCAGCHNANQTPNMAEVARTFIGTDLSKEHPVNMLYDNVVNPQLAPAPAITASGLKLYDNRVQCATCHNPHDPTNKPFLRVQNMQSNLCSTCHVK